MNLEEAVKAMTRNIISILIVIAMVIGAAMLYNNAINDGKNSADKQLCQSTQGLRGRYFNDIDCSKYGG